MESTISIQGPTYALKEFNALAVEAGISIRPRMPRFPPGTIVASTFGFEMLLSPGAMKVYTAIAVAICGYLKGRSTRRVTINILKSGRIEALDARGYSPDEIAKIIRECEGLLVFDEKPKEKKVREQAVDIPRKVKKTGRRT